MSPATRTDPYLAGNFQVNILLGGETLIAAAQSFSEIAGLEAAIDVVGYRTGDLNGNTVQKSPGLNRYPNVTLKRGLTSDSSLWSWIQGVLSGNLQRATVLISLRDQAGSPELVFRLSNAWPCKWTGPLLIADSSEVAIETLEICYEGLDIEFAP